MTHSSPHPNLPLAVLTIALMLVGCAGDADQDPPTETLTSDRSVPVEVLEVRPTTFEDVVQLTGTIEAINDATLSAEAAGTIRSLLPLGAAVGRGGSVAQIDAGLAQAQIEQAEATRAAAQAQLDLAEDQFRRQEPLYRDSIISALEFESVRAQVASARAQVAQADAGVAQAREQVSRTRVISPFAGVVERHLVERGEQVAPGSPVVRVVATSTVKVTAGVPERYGSDVRVGSPALVTPQAYGLPPQRGVLNFVGRTIDPQNRTFPVEMVIDNSDGLLKPQMVVRMEIVSRTLENVFTVPMGAVVRDETGPTIYIVDSSDGVERAAAQRVNLGSTAGDQVVVVSGIDAGDLVIVQGQTTVATGDVVRILDRRSVPVSTFDE